AVRDAVHEALEDPANVDALMQTLKLQGERWLRERGDKRGAGSATGKEVAKLKLVVERLEDAIERGQPVGERLKLRTAELARLEAKLAEPPPPKLTRAQLVERIDKSLSPLERMMRDYNEAKAEDAQQVREALRALGVDRVKVTPLDRGGWRVEGMAHLDRIIAGGSDAPINMGASPESSGTPRRAPAPRPRLHRGAEASAVDAAGELDGHGSLASTRYWISSSARCSSVCGIVSRRA